MIQSSVYLIDLYTRPQSVSYIASAAIKSVVVIRCKKNASFDSITAGFVASNYGHILTVAHGLAACVNKPNNIRVRYYNQDIEYKAALLRYNTEHDVALLQVPNGPKVPPLTIDKDNNYYLGEQAIAIGHPHKYFWSVSAGIVSADRFKYRPYRRYIQVTTPINPGNSGGPILNSDGEVMGIASFVSATAHYHGTDRILIPEETLGFIVPGETLNAILPNDIRR